MIHPLPSTCSARGQLAFCAVAPFERPAVAAHRSRNVRNEKPPEHLGTANIRPFRQFRRDRPFLYFPLGLLCECAPFATPAVLIRASGDLAFHPLLQADICCNTRIKSAFL